MKTMKMMKAMKKLKFWSRKKKKKKATFFTENEQYPPPSSSHFHHHYQYCYYPVEPSAPPLPSSYSWLQQYDQTQDTTTILGSDYQFTINSTASGIDKASSSEQVSCFGDSKDNIVNVSEHSTLPESANKTNSYQQYLVPNPVYGVLVAYDHQVRREREIAGAFGCVFAIGAHLIRCFFPCFHIRELK